MPMKTRFKLLKYILNSCIWKWKKPESRIQINKGLSLSLTVMSSGEITETQPQFSYLSKEGLGHGAVSSPFSSSKH